MGHTTDYTDKEHTLRKEKNSCTSLSKAPLLSQNLSHKTSNFPNIGS